MTADQEMRAWRVHQYGSPLEVLQQDTVAIPEPGPDEVVVRVQAIPLNLNDLERITGGNMMVRPEFPYSPGMEVMGVVDACGSGAEAWADRRIVATTKGAFGGFASQIFVGQLADFLKGKGFDGRAQWDPVFYIFSGVYVVGAILWAFVDSSKGVKDEEPNEQRP